MDPMNFVGAVGAALGDIRGSAVYVGETLVWQKPAPPETWTPLDLFANGELGGYYTADASWADAAMSVPAVVGGSVSALSDLSGNSNHLQSVASATLTGGKVQGLSFTGTGGSGISLPPSVLPPVFEVFLCYTPLTVTQWILLSGDRSPPPWWVVGENSSGAFNSTVTGVAFDGLFFDNVKFSGSTRKNVYDAANQAKTLFMQAGYTGPAVSRWRMFLHSAGNLTAPGIIHAILIREGRMTAAQREKLNQFWQSKLAA